jgi:ATP-dependent DNA helicase 2 subunit 2
MESVPVKLNGYSEELADRPEESHQALVETSYKNVNDLDGEFIPPERRVKAFRYGKQHIPIDSETESSLSMRFEKGMKVIGSIGLDECPLWLSAGEPSVCAPQSSTTSTGLSKERADADAIALSALAHALDDAKLALLVRCAFTEGTTSVHIGALTPRFTEAGDFLLYTPLPFQEDYNEYSLPRAPPHARVSLDDPRFVAARDFVQANSLDDDGHSTTMPWESLNPTLRAYRDLFESRALGAQRSPNDRPPLVLGVDETSASEFAARFELDPSCERNVRPRLGAEADAQDDWRRPTSSPSRDLDARARAPSSSPVAGEGLVDIVKTEDIENDAGTPARPNLDVFEDME